MKSTFVFFIVTFLFLSFFYCGQAEKEESSDEIVTECLALDVKAGERVGVRAYDKIGQGVGEYTFRYSSSNELTDTITLEKVQSFLWCTQNLECNQPKICFVGDISAGCQLITNALKQEPLNGEVKELQGDSTATFKGINKSENTILVEFSPSKVTFQVSQCED